jgi:tetratricopeptide (TPR) repeat protein
MQEFRRAFAAFWVIAGALTLALPHAGMAASPTGESDEEASSIATVDSSLGSYLAGRLARGLNDTEHAVEFYRRALAKDGSNRRIIEHAFLMEATEGNVDRARALALRLVKFDSSHRLARLWLGVSEFKRANYKLADRHFAAASDGPIGELTSGLAQAWTAVASRRASAAMRFTEYRRRADWARYYLRYHRALIADVMDNNATATQSYKLVHEADPRTPRITMAYMRYAARRGNFTLAEEVLKKNEQANGGQLHPSVQALARAVKARQRLDRLVKTPEEGLAEVFYGLGEALTTEGGLSLGVIYLQMALHLRPEFPFALAGLANAYESTKQFERAIATYGRIPPSTPMRLLIDIRRAKNLDSLDRVDEAKAVLVGLLAKNAQDEPSKRDQLVATSPRLTALQAIRVPDGLLRRGAKGGAVRDLQHALTILGHYSGPVNGDFGQLTRRALQRYQLAARIPADGVLGKRTSESLVATIEREIATEKSNISEFAAAPLDASDRLRVHNAIAEMMRRRKRYEESIEYYSKIIQTIQTPSRRQWVYWYARGTSYERLKQWPKAEVDLLKALELNPDQPLILNYLGYSWVDQNKNLERGLELISRAVQLKPDDGYIVDSLGWAYFRLGRYMEATEQLERAVELQPADPILNDHLGDAYWRVGRQREARFQWQLALTLKPEEDTIPLIRKKLLVGLPEEANKRSIGLPQPASEDQKKTLGKRASTTVITHPPLPR